MAAQMPNEAEPRLAGVQITVENGAVTACSTRLQPDCRSWALGSPSAWLNALIDGNAHGIEIGGDSRLAQTLLYGLHQVLFEYDVNSPLTPLP